MASIYDFEDPPPSNPKVEPVRRSKHRESLNQAQVAQGKRTLIGMVNAAFNALQDAMETADHATAVKAAVAILDRAGFGPKSTVDVNTTHIDLSQLSREELADRAALVTMRLRAKARDVIDVTPSPVSGSVM